MQFCSLDTIHHIAYNKHESKLPDALHCTLPSTLLIALDCTLPACLTVRSQLLSIAHSQSAWLALWSKLSRHSQVHSQACSQRPFQLHSMAHSQPAWLYAPKYTPGHALKDAPNCTRWHTPSELDCTLPSKFSRRSQAHSRAHSQLPIALDDTLPACLTLHCQVSSQDAPKYTPSTLPITPLSTILVHSRACCQGRSQLHSMAHSQPPWLYAPSKLSTRCQAHSQARSQVHSQSHLTICCPVCSGVLDQEICWVVGTRPREANGTRCSKWYQALWESLKAISLSLLQWSLYIQNDKVMMAAPRSGRLGPGVERISNRRLVAAAKIIMSVDIIVWTLSLARQLRRDLTMPHGHGGDNCSLGFCRKARQLDRGESRSPTQIFQWNLLPASHWLWVYVCAFGPGLMVLMAMVMITMVMVSVMVIIVPEASR